MLLLVRPVLLQVLSALLLVLPRPLLQRLLLQSGLLPVLLQVLLTLLPLAALDHP